MTATYTVPPPTALVTPHDRAGRPWWRADRLSLWTIALVLPMALALAAYSIVTELDAWRFEYMRAVDRAGLYLFLVGPVLCGVCTWNAYRSRTTLAGLRDGLPSPGLVARTSWLPVAATAMLVHAVVLVVHVAIAWRSGAIGGVDLLPVAVQLLAVAAACAAGALIGGVARGPMVAPTVLLAMLGANTLFAQWGFRRITQVGTGTADFTDLHYAPAFLGPKVVLFGALVVAALPWRSLRWVHGVRGRDAVAGIVAVAAFLSVWNYSGPMLQVRPEPRTCAGTAPTVCLPRSMSPLRADVATAVAGAVSALRERGVVDVPARFDVISRGATSVPRGTAGLLISGATLHDARALRREVARSLSAVQMCDDLTAVAGPSDNVLFSRASLDGWVQVHTEAVESGSFPPDAVAALDSPAGRASGALPQLFHALWTCSTSVRPPT